MSVRVMTWVWEHSRAAGAERLVLLAIADAARDDGMDAWPSIRTIARKANVDTRTAQRAVRRLLDLGELAVTMNAGKGGANLYRVIMAPRQDATPGETPPPGTVPPGEMPPRRNATPASDPEPPGEMPPTPRRDATRTVLEPSKTRSKEAQPLVDRFNDFWAVYPRKAAKPAAQRAWTSAVRRADPDVILAGARRYRDDPNREQPFTAHPATWLNRDSWNDDPLPSRASPSRPPAPEQRRPGDYSHLRASTDF